MIKNLVLCTMLIVPAFLCAQEIEASESAKQNIALISVAKELPKEGTYQIILSKDADPNLITEDQLMNINLKRQYREDFLWKLNDDITIKILSTQKINTNDFTAPKKFIYK